MLQRRIQDFPEGAANLTGGTNLLLPPANEVWGKVIFSEACVKNSVHRGGEGGVPDQVHPPGPGRYTPPGPGRYTPRDQAGTPPQDQAGTSPRDQAGTPPPSPETRQVHPPGPGRYTPPDQAGTPSPPDQAGTPPQTRQVHPPPFRDQAGTPPPPRYTPPRDTVNARAVRILLECNLVLHNFC